MTNRQHFILILLLGSLATISPFSIDMYLPAFPRIAEDFGTSISMVQLSLTSYFIGIAAGQILYGPLLDRFGRKRPLYAGLFVYILASLGCAFTPSAESLIVMRFLQALGGCAGMVAAHALVRDIFPVNKTAQALSWITLVVAVSPMVAPALGGFVTVKLGWHAIFIILGVITAIILYFSYSLLPFGREADPSLSLKPRAVIGNFISVIKQPQFLVYTLAGGFASAAPFAYIAGSADVFINNYGVSEEDYGLIFGIIAGIIIASSQLNHLLLRKFSSQAIIRASLLFQSITATVLLGLAVFTSLSLLALIALIALMLAGHGVVNPNASALSLAPFTRLTGSAASLGGSFRMAMGGVASGLVSAFHDGTSVPMIAVMAGCILSALMLLTAGAGLYQSGSPPPEGPDL